ncbi:MAG: hypothetical protein K0R98_1663 [Rickettsiaceae bacterium]|jgi:hypothetical protein|nr:hypothetical protein [Rickettsiaceae bacterium]
MSNQHNYQPDDSDDDLNLAIALSLSLQPTEIKSDELTSLARKVCENENAFYKMMSRAGYIFIEKIPSDDLKVKEDLDNAALEYVRQWFADKRKNGYTTFVISIGSHGSDEQIFPTFAKNKENVAVLNIDRDFSKEEFIESASSNITKMRHIFDINKFKQSYLETVVQIFEELRTTNNKVVLIDSVLPDGFKKVSNTMRDFLNLNNKNLVYIQSYFDKYPSAILNQHFFDTFEKDSSIIVDNISDLKLISNPTGLINKVWNLKLKQSYEQSDLDTLVKENNFSQFGKFFAGGLKDISIEDLFPQKAAEKEEKSMSSSSFGERVSSKGKERYKD